MRLFDYTEYFEKSKPYVLQKNGKNEFVTRQKTPKLSFFKKIS